MIDFLLSNHLLILLAVMLLAVWNGVREKKLYYTERGGKKYWTVEHQEPYSLWEMIKGERLPCFYIK